jgi:uncharacterized membrane protein YccC
LGCLQQHAVLEPVAEHDDCLQQQPSEPEHSVSGAVQQLAVHCCGDDQHSGTEQLAEHTELQQTADEQAEHKLQLAEQILPGPAEHGSYQRMQMHRKLLQELLKTCT